MLDVRYSAKFKKDYKAIIKRGWNPQLLQDVLDILCAEQPLPSKYKDHNLSGSYKGHRECHITPDWLLVYKIDNRRWRQMMIDNTDLFKKLEAQKISIGALKKDEVVFQAFWEDFTLRFCWSSNAIEGNTLDLEETIDVILYDQVRGGHTYQEYTEAKSLYKAICQQMQAEGREISEDWIKRCDQLITGGDGEYRKKDVYVGTITEAVYFPPNYPDVPGEMEELLKAARINAGSIEELLQKTAEFHMRFERIHPFADGNGRIGRMIMNQQLLNNGLLPIAIDPASKYRQSFRVYDKNKDLSPLIHLIAARELESIERVSELSEKRERTEARRGRGRKSKTR